MLEQSFAIIEPMINIDDFSKVEMSVGKVLEAESIEGSEKLLKLRVDFGEEDEIGQPTVRQVLSGIAKWYQPQDLIDKSFVFVTNLEARSMMGLESQAMILAASNDSEVVLVEPNKPIKPGSKIG